MDYSCQKDAVKRDSDFVILVAGLFINTNVRFSCSKSSVIVCVICLGCARRRLIDVHEEYVHHAVGLFNEISNARAKQCVENCLRVGVERDTVISIA